MSTLSLTCFLVAHLIELFTVPILPGFGSWHVGAMFHYFPAHLPPPPTATAKHGPCRRGHCYLHLHHCLRLELPPHPPFEAIPSFQTRAPPPRKTHFWAPLAPSQYRGQSSYLSLTTLCSTGVVTLCSPCRLRLTVLWGQTVRSWSSLSFPSAALARCTLSE